MKARTYDLITIAIILTILAFGESLVESVTGIVVTVIAFGIAYLLQKVKESKNHD